MASVGGKLWWWLVVVVGGGVSGREWVLKRGTFVMDMGEQESSGGERRRGSLSAKEGWDGVGRWEQSIQ